MDGTFKACVTLCPIQLKNGRVITYTNVERKEDPRKITHIWCVDMNKNLTYAN
jgi:hypothetical protein